MKHFMITLATATFLVSSISGISGAAAIGLSSGSASKEVNKKVGIGTAYQNDGQTPMEAGEKFRDGQVQFLQDKLKVDDVLTIMESISNNLILKVELESNKWDVVVYEYDLGRRVKYTLNAETGEIIQRFVLRRY